MTDVDVIVVPSSALTPFQRADVHRLFDATYERADHDYLDTSMGLLRFVALAASRADERERDERAGPRAGHREAGDTGGEAPIVGFALGESRCLDLAGLPDQQVGLAGLCCVDSRFRRQGLFRSLERAALTEELEPLGHGRLLAAGRMAHPASFRVMSGNPTVLPRRGVTPNPFQQEVARVVAGCYGVRDFDPISFVCRGRGRPIGYPKVTVEVDPEEWDVFASVDRERGDSLLGLSWLPDGPLGW